MSEQTFQLMRFQILTAALNEKFGGKLSDAYVYAWDTGVYPACDDSADWHEPFRENFPISEEMVTSLVKFLDERWIEKNVPTFYELEQHYEVRRGGVEWDRSSLIRVCRYIYLSESFDEDFWSKLISPAAHPMEAASIVREYDRENDLYLM